MSAFTTIARAFKGGLAPKPARGYLIQLDGFKGDEIVKQSLRAFQYFPATVSDSQATNYQTKVIPGLSHPLYQWTSGGARTIAFEAIFTRDRTYTSSEQQDINSTRSGATSNGTAVVGSVTLPKAIQSNSDDRNVDIPSAVAWLRANLLPEYSSNGQGTFSQTPLRPRPPSKLILGMPGMRLNWGVPSLPYDEIHCIMTSCEVAYEGFFHDGTPRMAKVSLAFAEIIQVGGRIVVQDGGTKRYLGLAGYNLTGNRSQGDGNG